MGANLSGGSNSRRYRKRGFSEINVTPFVDVMLVLLIIFMVTAPMLTAGVKVDLPESKAAALPGQDEPLTISIKSDGRIYLQETVIELDELADKLSAIVGEKRDTRIFVRGDKTVDYGFVMRVMGELSASGFSKVGLVTTDLPQRASSRKR